MMPDAVELVERLYKWFNTGEIDRLLASIHEDVIWANGMEGGHLHGRNEVRRYWTRQWATIDPKVEPSTFSIAPTGRSSSKSIKSCAILAVTSWWTPRQV